MTYQISNNQENLNSWLKENTQNPAFTLSFEWLEILKNENLAVERLAITENGQIQAVTTVIYQKLPLGMKYAFCPIGPVYSDNANRAEVLKTLQKYFAQKNCIFFRFEPASEIPLGLPIKKTRDINPRATLKLDLKKSPNELLAVFHPKTRYNIRLAEKKLTAKMEKNLDIFLDLSRKTGERDKFKLHAKKHYAEILNSPFAHQITIYSDTTPVASGIFIGFGETFTYLFGASDHNYRQLMAPYLLQWTAIKTAQAYGYPIYDFFGVSPKANDKISLQYAGVTRFKAGFNGEFSEKPGTFDYIISDKKYFLYTILRKIRSIF